MIKVEQILIWLGVVSLGWMIFFLSFSENLDPAFASLFSGEGAGPIVVAVLFLAGVLGVFLLLANMGRGLRRAAGPRLLSLLVFLLALAAFWRLYA